MTAAPRGVARAASRRKRVAWIVVDRRGYPVFNQGRSLDDEEGAYMMADPVLEYSVVRVEYEWLVRAGRSRMGGARK